MKIKVAVLIALLASSIAMDLHAQVKQQPIPQIRKKDGRFALFVDGAPYLMLGAQVHNSSTWPATLPKVWPAMEFLNVNTVEAPIYWEQFEPKPRQYDYSVTDTLLAQARQHHVRLVILWFGTWKNGSQHYMPEWMKLAPDRYPHVVDKNGHAVDSPSPFATPSKLPKPSRCSAPALVMRPTVGRARRTNSATSPMRFAPISTTALPCEASKRSSVTGTPI